MARDLDRHFRCDGDFDGGRQHLVDMARSHVDLLVGPLPGIDIAAFTEDRESAQEDLAAQGELRVDRPLARVLGVPDEIGCGRRLQERALRDRHREVQLRHKREREIR